MTTNQPINRILFLSGMVSEENTTSLMADIININNHDDLVMDNATADLNFKVQGLTIRKMTDGYPTCVALGDGTQLGIGLSDKFYENAREPITLHIKTSGGYVEDGLALINLIRTSKTPIHAIVHYGHSMGFAIASACDYRIGYPTTRMMFHDISGGFHGTAEKSIRSSAEMKSLRDLAFSVVVDNTKLTVEDLDKIYNEIDDRYFTGDELLEFGLLDEIEEYSIPEHKKAAMQNKAIELIAEDNKKELIGNLADKLSTIRTRQMVINEIYDLMNDDNMEIIEHYLEVGSLCGTEISLDKLEEFLEYIKDFTKEDPYDVYKVL